MTSQDMRHIPGGYARVEEPVKCERDIVLGLEERLGAGVWGSTHFPVQLNQRVIVGIGQLGREEQSQSFDPFSVHRLRVQQTR